MSAGSQGCSLAWLPGPLNHCTRRQFLQWGNLWTCLSTWVWYYKPNIRLYVDVCDFSWFYFLLRGLEGSSFWFFFSCTRADGRVRGSLWCTLLYLRRDGLSPNKWDARSLLGLSVPGQEGRPTVLPGLPALHLALIKYTADDVSLAPGSLGFPLGTKHPGMGRQLWQLSLKAQALHVLR